MGAPFSREIEKAAKKYGLDPDLLTAICFVESSFDPGAVRPEPNFQRKYIDPHPTYGRMDPATRSLLASSLGLMQTMGVVAHENGLPVTLLTTLYRPEVSLEYGAKFLAKLFKRYDGLTDDLKMSDMVAAYNAGSAMTGKTGKYVNQKYVDKVLKKYWEIKRGKNENKGRSGGTLEGKTTGIGLDPGAL